MLSRVALATAAAAGGCTFSAADQAGERYRCSSAGDCPDGLACSGGFCGDQAPAGDAALIDAPLVTSVCPPGGALLVDDFDSNQLDLSLWMSWSEGTTTVDLAESRLDITAHADDEGGGVYTLAASPLDESSLVVEVITPDDYSSSTMGVELLAEGASTALVTFCRDNDDLVTKVDGPTTPPEEFSDTFSPDKHRFWRIEEVGDQIRFSSSPDGSTWSNLGVASSIDLPASTRLSLWGENYATATPLVLSFGSATWCKMTP